MRCHLTVNLLVHLKAEVQRSANVLAARSSILPDRYGTINIVPMVLSPMMYSR